MHALTHKALAHEWWGSVWKENVWSWHGAIRLGKEREWEGNGSSGRWVGSAAVAQQEGVSEIERFGREQGQERRGNGKPVVGKSAALL